MPISCIAFGADNTFTIKNKNKKERSNFSTCFWSE
jgi:hypothetical protein